ncbi:MAG: hypothetical protein KGZ69_16165 [Methylomonas sp.]|nr:hypothetical protein [Methylomonas sp.]
MSKSSSNRVLEGDFRPLSGSQSNAESYPINQPFNPLASSSSSGMDLANPLGKSDALGSGMLSAVMHVRELDAQYVSREKGLLARFFGKESERDKRIAQHELAQTGQVCTFLENKLTMECNAIYLRCQDDVNNWLARHRIASRRDLITFATEELQGLKNTIEDRRECYSDYLRRRIQRLDRNRDMALLVEAEVADMQTEMAEHLAFLRELEEHFRQAVKQKIG